MKKLRLFIIIAAILLFTTACSEKAAVNKYVERTPGEAASLSGDEFVTIGEGDEMLLMLNPSNGTIRWMEKDSEEYIDNKIFDPEQANPTLKSDIVAYYYTGSVSQPYTSYSSMDSYTYGIEMDTISYEWIDNGIRVVYDIGSDKVTYKDFPAYISEARMNELVLGYLDAAQQKTVLKQYRLTKSGVYARKANEESPLAGMAAPQLYRLFYEVGKYNYEELEKDNIEYNKADETPQRQIIKMTMDYYLDGEDLVVRVPTKEIAYSEDFPLKSLDILPYFLSTKERSDGYLFIPDGSGALIYLDNKKITEYQYTSRYFGGDVLINADSYTTSNGSMNLPIYGMKVGNKAILGIIEKGAETATLSAYANGAFNGIPYSRISLNFAIREDQTLSSFSGAITNFTLKKASPDYYSGDIQIRYQFLSGEEADYSSMAKAYSNYLQKNMGLTRHDFVSDANFFAEILGEVDKTEYFMGIPYEGKAALTTFGQAEEILNHLSGMGIKNMIVDYKGMVNGGLNQRSVRKVEISDRLGGKKGLQKLIETASRVDAQIYPGIRLQTAATSKGLPKNRRAFFISGQVAELYDFEPVQYSAVKESDYPTYILNPKYLPKYINRFQKSYEKLGLTNIGSDDFLTFIAGTYKKEEEISMTNAEPYYMEALEKLSSRYHLMLSDPMVSAYGSVDFITDLPMESSKMKVFDASIPFVQLVLEDYIIYSSEVINDNTYDVWNTVMKAIETKSALKFRFMYEDTSILKDTEADHIYTAEYEKWKETVGEYYQIYNAFYQQVKDASMIHHEIINRDNNIRVVTYSNGIKVYLNYSMEDIDIDGHLVPANHFVVQ